MRRYAPVLVMVALLSVGCGTRQSHEDVLAASAGGTTQQRVDGQVAGSVLDDTTSSDVSNAGATDTATGSTAPGASSARQSGRTVEGTASEAQSPGVAGPISGGSKSPIKLGNVGIYSGVAGAPFVGGPQAIRAWVRDVNTRGGINGHRVQFTVIDDGLDPARHRAGIQKLVEQDGVLAFVGNNETVTGPGMIPYHEQHRIPVIGSDSGSPHYYRSKMHFPEASNGNAKFLADLGSAASVAVPQGKLRYATFTCTEAASCGDADRVYAEHAKDFGMTDVYRARTSIAQPDYTAECLQAHNNRADVIVTVLDGPSQGRVAAACARQNYRPLIVGSTALSTMAKQPALDGLVFGSGAFPWVSSDTPARAEFQRVINKYAPGAVFSLATTLGWTSAKIFEKAAANMPEPPSNNWVLKGLWSMRDDDLGGLTYPLSFYEGKPAEPRSCAFPMQIKNGKWIALGDGKVRCFKFP